MKSFNFLTKQNLNIVTYLGSDMLAKAIPFLFIPLITKYLNPNEYGNISLFNISVEIVVIIIIMGGNSYYKVHYYQEENKTDLFYSIFYNITLYFAVFFVFSLLLLLIIPRIYFIEILPVITLVAYMQAILYLLISHYQCKEDALKVGFTNLLFSLINSIVMVMLITIFHLREEARYYSYLTALLVSISFIGYHYLRKNRVKKNFQINRGLLKFGLGIMPHALSWWARSGVDRLLIGWFLSVSVLGVYSLALQMLSFLMILCNAMNQAFIPSIMFDLSNRDYKKVKKRIYTIISVLSFACFIFGLLIPFIFKNFIDTKYDGALEYLPYMCWVFSLQGIIVVFSNVLYYFKHEKYLSTITFSTAILHVITLTIMLDFNVGIISIVYSSTITFLISAYFVIHKSLRLMS